MGAPYSHGQAILRVASGAAIVVSVILASGGLISTAWAWPNALEMPVWRQLGLAAFVGSPLIASALALVCVAERRPSPRPELILLAALVWQLTWIILILVIPN